MEEVICQTLKPKDQFLKFNKKNLIVEVSLICGSSLSSPQFKAMYISHLIKKSGRNLKPKV